MWGKDSELEGGYKNLSNRVVRAQRLSVMYWLKNSLCSTAVAVWAWWRACVLTGCRWGEKLSWRGEGHRCTQWEGVSQTAGSAALPTRTWPERKKVSVFMRAELQKLILTDQSLFTRARLTTQTIHLNTHHPTSWAKCCYWLQLVNSDKLQSAVRLHLLLLTPLCICIFNVC